MAKSKYGHLICTELMPNVPLPPLLPTVSVLALPDRLSTIALAPPVSPATVPL